MAVRGSIAGMKMWVRRATSATEEGEALVALKVSLGNSKNPSDKIWIKPGVDWLRVEANCSKSNLVMGSLFGNVDAFLWMLPTAVRTSEFQGLQGLLRSAGGLSLEKRMERVHDLSRVAIRANVPIAQMRQVCNPIDSSSFASVQDDKGNGSVGNSNSETDTANSGTGVTSNMYRQRQGMRSFDFSNLYHDYDQTLDGKMNQQKMYKLLKHSGVWLERDEVAYVFRYMDVSQNGRVSREEYAKCMAMTDYELDNVVEQMRAKLLPGNVLEDTKNRNDAKETRILAQVFKLINTNNDGVVSLSEFMTLMAALEIYVTEEEARKVLRFMDIDGDDRVEENDFVMFIKHVNETHAKRAHRLRETANQLRRWINRGSTHSIDTTNSDVSNQKQWDELKERHEKARGTFPNFLDADDVLLTCGYLGSWTSPLGSRELLLMIAPEQNGRITQSDLNSFIARSVRSYGELLALCDRDIMKPIFDSYRAYQLGIKNESKNCQVLEMDYNRLVREVIQEIQNTVVPGATASRGGDDGYTPEVVSVPQFKNGIEAAMRRYKEFDGRALNTEEWADLACLTGSAVAEEDIYGVDVAKFMDGICRAVAGAVDEAGLAGQVVASMDQLVKEIQRLIRAEALEAGHSSKLNYKAAFDMINKDGDDHLSIEEFRANLVRLQLSHLCPEGEMPKLLRLFDVNNKGYITFEDFMGFVNKYKGAADDGSTVMDGIDKELDDPQYMSDTPPLAITRNADCDYVVWFIWRQCCRIEPSDPECIVTELEAACAETELTSNEGSISMKELWNLLFELKIHTNGNISKSVFDKGMRYLLMDNRNKRADDHHAESQVDYGALCRYVVRMGRGHSSMRDEKKSKDLSEYRRLRSDLRQFLLSLNASEYSSGYTPRYADTSQGDDRIRRIEKVFRRMDSDGDGKLNPAEFKSSLKRLGYKNEKQWSWSVVQLFFSDLDSDSDGLVSLDELTRLFSNDERPAHLSLQNPDSEAPPAYSADIDPEDELFSGMKGAFAESELFYKVYTVLKDMVPQGDCSTPIDAIHKAVRRFFAKNDPKSRGQVSEERYRAFLRRSGLLDRLTSGELRRTAEVLRRRNTRDAGGGSSIDYEKFLTLLATATTNGPSAKGDMVLMRLREAASQSASAGRPFYGLCALADPTNSGKLTKEELILACKMMGCTMTAADMDTLREYAADGAFTKDGMIDYKEINFVVSHEQPRGQDLFNMGPTSFTSQAPSANRYTGANAAATPFGVTPAPPTRGGAFTGGSAERLNGFGTFSTPRGSYDRIPPTPMPMHSTLPAHRGGGATGVGLGHPADERELAMLADRVVRVLDTMQETLPRLLEVHDHNRSGYCSSRAFLQVMDSIGVNMTSNDVALLSTAFPAGLDRVDYDSFWRFAQSSSGSGNHGMGGDAYNPASATTYGLKDPVYINARMLSRLGDCYAEGRDPRTVFATYDVDGTGLIDAWRFREVLQRLQLLSLEAHVEAACVDFACLRNRDQVCYDDFCRVLDSAEADYGMGAGGHRGTGGGMHDRDARDVDYRDRPPLDRSVDRTADRSAGRGAMGSDNVEKWLAYQASPKLKREFADVYESLNKFKNQQTGSTFRDFPIALDDGSDYPAVPADRWNTSGDVRGSVGFSRDYGTGLRAPKTTDSRDFGQAIAVRSSAGDRGSGRYGSTASYGSEEWRRRSSSGGGHRGADSPKPQPTSPSKVGSKMWGSHTSLDLKGVTPRVNAGLWCCAVCLYTENDVSGDKCTICDSPNYNKRADFVVKEQCKNCTFLNGQYSNECEMCGAGLSRSENAGSSSDEYKTDRQRRY